jgi:DNA polymerase-1
MREHKRDIGGQPVVIRAVETEEDLEEFRAFIRANIAGVGVDSETTGLDIYSGGFRCRLVQFGTASLAYVIPVERGGPFAEDVRLALKGLQSLTLHNAAYDLQVFDRALGVPMELLWPKVRDTRVLAHLIDPRGQDEGGIGHGLEGLTRFYIDPLVADGVKTLMTDLAKTHKTTKSEIWKTVDYDDPHYQLYSGMDPILAVRLAQKLRPLVPKESTHLIRYEHRVAAVCSYMERTGFLLDMEYTKQLSEELVDAELAYEWKAKSFGCENVNSTEQVADILEARGVRIKERTPSGRRKVDKVLLGSLVEAGDEFAEAVMEAKKARKWRMTWVEGFLVGADPTGRCHASINPLRARTARMSITGIPAQTLPAGDSTIRRCFLADDGQVMASVDYQAQELRVLAALSGDRTMQGAFRTGADLHQITADASGVSRKVGKTVNFAYVYGSGPKNIANQCGIDVDTAKKVIAGFEQAYPRVKQLSQSLQQQARRDGFVMTPSGRRLPVDPERAYSALNYLIQSSSRDITAGGLLRLHDQGFTPYLRLPIHDEILCSLPERKAQWGAERIGEIMATNFKGVHIGTDAEVGGRSWGSLYGSDY